MSVLPNHNAAPIREQTTVEEAPRYRWPSQQHRVPRKCPREHCGGSAEIDVPTADHPRADATCGLCSRVLAELLHDGYRRMTPAAFAALPTKQPTAPPPPPLPRCQDCDRPRELNYHRRCAACSDAKRKATSQRVQSDYRRRVKAGQTVATRRWATNYDACTQCGTTTAPHNGHGRCMRCRDRAAEYARKKAREVAS